MATRREPFPTEPEDFDADVRIAFDTVSQMYVLEDEDGEEWEWLAKQGKWVPVTDEAELESQQEAYKVAGVDESEPAVDPRKRKATAEADKSTGNGQAKKQKAEQGVNAIYITSLPDDVTEKEVHDVFSRYGVIAENVETNKPRIKLYEDEQGNFKGEALIVFFRPESVKLAIDMLDETDFRRDDPVVTGPMRIQPADRSFKSQKERPLADDKAKTKGTDAYRDRKKVIKKNQEMNSRLADWDDDDPSVLPDTSSRWDKVVILKNMFTLQTLEEDKTAQLDIVEDVREECAKLGPVTNVTLFDKEPAGVVTVRFSNALAAQACVDKMNDRPFDHRLVKAYIADGTERFKKTTKFDYDEEEEAARLEEYSRFIESEQA